MFNKNKIFFLLLLIIIPYLTVFKAFFLTGPLIWGDAPYFFPENLNELFLKPMMWDFRNSNFGASQTQVLWLYLPTFLMGLLGKLGISADIAIRIIFYFPATILAFLGSFLFIKRFVKNNIAASLGSFLYVFNTYFLLLIDGGQIGLALAYGLFPLFLYFINKGNFLFSVLFFFFLTNTDLRIALLVLLVYFLINFNKLSKNIIYVILATFLLDAFWIVPFILNGFSGEGIIQVKNALPANFITLFNSLTIFNPHFPLNEFGKINPIPWYFIFLPLLLFINVIFKNRKDNLVFYVLFLSFVFLISMPFGPLRPVFDFLIDHIPLAYSFRDSTKFFIPLILVASILLAKTLEGVKSNLFSFIVYLYLLILILPALTGNLSGVLAGRKFDENYHKIYQNLVSDKNFYRTIWFPERPPFGFSAKGKEGISAGELYKEIPFAMMISGTYDLFNYLHDEKLSSWFEVLGIKYAFFPEPPRQKNWTEVDLANRKLFLEFIDSLGFKKLELSTDFPVYEVSKSRDKIYGAKKIFIAVGDAGFYDKTDFTKIPGLFVEDGIIIPDELFNLPEGSAILVLHDATIDDLKMAFLQHTFISDKNLVSGHWGKYKASEMLQWRYELLKQGISNFDFGYNKGIYFSSIKNEEMNFKINAPVSNKYYLAARSLSATESAGIKVKFNGREEEVKNIGSRFRWNFIGPVNLSKGDYVINFKNLGGFSAINTIALIDEEKFNEGQIKADLLIQRFNTQENPEINDKNVFTINYRQNNLTSYTISDFPHSGWVVFSDHFDKGWELEGSSKPYPVYSMVNGFYVNQSMPHLNLKYAPQKYVDQGIILSIGSFFTFLVILVLKLFKK